MAGRVRARSITQRSRIGRGAGQMTHPQESRARSADGDGRAQVLPRGLGVFSAALGGVELSAPRPFLRSIGIRPTPFSTSMARVVGAREEAVVPGLLSRPRPSTWLWARVNGDLIDMALLGAALSDRRNDRRRVGAVAAAVAGVTALDLYSAVRSMAPKALGARDGVVHRTAAVTIRRPVAEVYRTFRDLERLPSFATHVVSVEMLDERRSRWTASAPMGRRVQWVAEIVDEEPERRICWRSVEKTAVPNQGCVEFRPAPGGIGTEMIVDIEYVPPAGVMGAAVARLLGEEPRHQIHDELRRLKQIMETREPIRSDASPDGIRTTRQVRQRPAQPLPAPMRGA